MNPLKLINSATAEENPGTKSDSDTDELLRGITEKNERIEYALMQLIKEQAAERFSIYRQRKYDIIARLVTEWPNWGVSVDFYTFFILPLLKNSYLLHFINLSDSYSLKNFKINAGYYDPDEKTIKYFIFRNALTENMTLIDFAISNIQDSQYLIPDDNDRNSSSENLNEIKALLKSKLMIFGNSERFHLIRARDGDIGVQAFIMFIEGVLRNAAKHRPNPSMNDDSIELKIIAFNSLNELNQYIDEPIPESSKDFYNIHLLISLNKDNDRLLNNDAHNSQLLSEFLNTKFNERILNSDGNVLPGCWGIKEMKTAALFLGGAPVDSVNDDSCKPNISDILRIKRSKVDVKNPIWKDGGTRICYILRLEKPRYILILTQNSNIEENNHIDWKGILFIDKQNIGNQSKKIESFDYDFLFINGNEEILNTGRENIRQFSLPRRQISGAWSEIVDGCYNSLDLVIKLYQYWLEKIYKEKKERESGFSNDSNAISIQIHFDNNQELETKWKQLLENWIFEKNFSKCFCFSFGYDRDRQKNIKIYQHSTIKTYIHSRNHRVIRQGLFKKKESNEPCYYYQHMSNSDPFFNFFSTLMDNENSSDLSKIILLQLLESTLMNILIIDERIAQTVISKAAPDEPLISLKEKLYWMGIYIADKIIIENNEGIKTDIWLSETSNENSESCPQKVTFSFNATNFTDQIENQFIDIIFIHYSKLKKISEGLNLKEQETIELLKKKIPHIIVHTGSGKTSNFQKDSSFLEYSTLAKYIIQEPSKYYLVQIALNLKE